jgi:PadR family transcriptional regulator, regulatory protein PadR
VIEENMPQPTVLLQGTLDVLILRTLVQGPMDFSGVAQRIHLVSKDMLQIEQGSLYPALYRLEWFWVEPPRQPDDDRVSETAAVSHLP